MTPTLTENIWW